MSLAERLESGPPKAGRRCAVCVLIPTLDGEEAAALDAMLRSDRWPDSKTWDALKDEGHLAHLETDQSLGAHRRRCMTT